jgi:CRISPR/Cas system CMR-associated protein Cmr1 (group 7 of RAMP superfamily)
VQDASQQSSEVNALNENISAVFGSLKRQSDILNKEHGEAELRQRMVEYTQEKNRSTNSLLQLYGVLNIVAVGLLLYIYRS